MRQRLLLLCAFVLCLAPGCAAASGDAAAARGDPLVHALATVGVKYRYGGSSPETGFDCSGLVAYVFEQAWGQPLPRSTQEQSTVGRRVKLRDLEPGDLVFYNTRNRAFSHVGIYLGDGRFVHAPRPGARVRIESFHSRYWRARFNGARRLDRPET
jgi:cell wall-associated NlpC family hydrolase